MRSYFLKSTLTAFSLSCALFGFADMEMNSTDATTSQQDKVITPNVSPVIQHGFDVFVTADFIYWSGRLENINYTHTSILAGDPGTKWSVQHKMSPGFKAGIGLDLHHDGWDTCFKYTYFHTSSSSIETTTGINPGSPLAAYSNAVVFSSGASSITNTPQQWNLRFNVVDWELGRNFYISPKLLLRPFMGLKGTWQTQTNNFTDVQLHEQFNSQGELVLQATNNKIIHNNTQHFWGLGIRTGLNTSWQFNKNWSLFADTALASLWGQFTASRADIATQVPLDKSSVAPLGDITFIELTTRIHVLRPVMEFDIGARWDYWFLDDDYHFRVQVAWEEQIWFDQNQFLQIQATNNYGSLNLQGLTIDFRLDF